MVATVALAVAAAVLAVAPASVVVGQRPVCSYSGGASSPCASQTAGDYTCCDTSGGMPFWWDATVNTTGNQVWGSGASLALQTIPLGFDFEYYGYPYQSITLGTQGFIAVGEASTTTSGYPTTFPSTSQNHGTIAAHFIGSGQLENVRVAQVTRGGSLGVVVHYEGRFTSSADLVIFQVSFWNETNHVEINYLTAPSHGTNIGFESISEVYGLEWRDQSNPAPLSMEGWAILPPVQTPPNPSYTCTYPAIPLSPCAASATVLDQSGMTCCDTEGGAPYIWDSSISYVGTEVFADASSSTTDVVQLGFEMKYYDELYTQVRLGAGGWLSLSDDDYDSSYPSSFPSTSNNPGVIGITRLASCHSLKYIRTTHPVSGAQGIIFQFVGRASSSEYETANRYQVGLYADGLISINWQMTTSATRTIGWENRAETLGFEYTRGTTQFFHERLDILPDPVPAGTAFNNTCSYTGGSPVSSCAAADVASSSGGYLCCDSEGGMDYRWLDFASSSNVTVVWGTTQTTATAQTVPLPFTFPWYDRCYSSITVTTRGYLGFGGQTINSYPSFFPSTSNAEGLVGYLSMSQTDELQYMPVTHPARPSVRGIVIEHKGKESGASASRANRIQVHLYEDGVIEIYYQLTNSDSWRIGFESEDEQNGFTYATGSTFFFYREPVAFYPNSTNTACVVPLTTGVAGSGSGSGSGSGGSGANPTQIPNPWTGGFLNATDAASVESPTAIVAAIAVAVAATAGLA